MTIKKLEILGYKGFSKKKSIGFAIPNGKEGSGMTVLVGPNSAGKSTVLETLGSFNKGDVTFSSDKRNVKAGDKVEISIKYKNDDGQITDYSIKTVPSGGSETIIEPQGHITSLLTLPSRRFFNPHFGKNNFQRSKYQKSMGGTQQFRSQPTDAFVYRLFEVSNPEKRPLFDAVLEKVMSPIPDWTIDQNSTGQYFLKFKNNGMFHTSEGVGEGILNLFYIIDALYDSSPNSTIVIDEPEVSLHPSFQRKLTTLLLEYSKDRQIIIATHSPYFLPLEYIGNGMSITRVNNTNNGTKFFTVSQATKQKLSKLLLDINNPHILGLNARELFFMDENIILVEGQEDVIIYPKIAEQVEKVFEGNFFGWGVGGASKMQCFAQLIKELGFTKVVGLLDGDKPEELEGLKEGYPEYLFLDIPTDDIRDKKVVKPRGPIEGLVNTGGSLKDCYVDNMKKLIDQVNEHLEK